MALTRSMLSGMGLDDKQSAAIIEAHTETVNGLKDKYDSLKEKTKDYQELKDENRRLKEESDSEWKAKYDKEHSDFENYKSEQASKDTKRAKETAYKAILKKVGINEKRFDSILRVTELDSVELDEDGNIKDADKVEKSVKEEWSDLIPSSSKTGAQVEHPSSGSSGGTMTKEEIMKIKNTAERQKAIMDNPQLF